ncbi:transcriptional regulatory [Fusarium albosuccineum]|uniref:Transcriptional regulatory n=1 Tax=Fusarium albosuccineum TaxID=1237068 RepID=A0A8H4LN90_9HYPO|nr:transcriptional regulatory [Fusarium albosuccineum]
MISVISEPGQMSPSLEALVFAVYFAAATSLSDDEMVAISPETTRQTLLQRCKLGLSHAAAKADLLNEPNTCLRVHDNSRAVWVLIGTAIRLAQSIGIHRDGASLKLDPFESELRLLRLWWQLCLLDSRAPEDHGFANTIENLGLNARSGPDAACTLQDIEKQRAEMEKHNQRVEARFLTLPRASDLRSLASAHYYTACSKMKFMLQVRQELQISTKYTWIFKTYTQWYALAYVLRYLCAFPSAPGTQEAWLLVNRTFSTVSYAQQPTSDPPAPTGRNSIWRCLALLRYQALSARAAAQGSSVAGPSPPAASTDRGTLPSPGTTGLPDPFVTDSDSYSWGPSVHQMESSDLLSGLPAQLSDQWQSGFPSFGQLAMPEMLYLPEWNDIVNRG